MLRFIFNRPTKEQIKDRFNTSHVTVYLTLLVSQGHTELFQYISCYGLSNAFKPFFENTFLFFPVFIRVSSFFTNRLWLICFPYYNLTKHLIFQAFLDFFPQKRLVKILVVYSI